MGPTDEELVALGRLWDDVHRHLAEARANLPRAAPPDLPKLLAKTCSIAYPHIT